MFKNIMRIYISIVLISGATLISMEQKKEDASLMSAIEHELNDGIEQLPLQQGTLEPSALKGKSPAISEQEDTTEIEGSESLIFQKVLAGSNQSEIATLEGLAEITNKNNFSTELSRMIVDNSPEAVKRALACSHYGQRVSMLFYGDRGTGKTSLAYAIAQVNNMETYYVPVYSIINQYQGSGETNLNTLLLPIIKKYSAKPVAPENRCIVLLDEIDQACGYNADNKSRGVSLALKGLLDSRIGTSNIIFIGATNKIKEIPEDIQAAMSFNIEIPQPSIDYLKQILGQLLTEFAKEANGKWRIHGKLATDQFLNDFAKSVKGISVRYLKDSVLIKAKSRTFLRAYTTGRPAELTEEDMWVGLQEHKNERQIQEEGRFSKICKNGYAFLQGALPFANFVFQVGQSVKSSREQRRQFEQSQKLQENIAGAQMVQNAIQWAVGLSVQERHHNDQIKLQKEQMDNNERAVNVQQKQAILGGTLQVAGIGATIGGTVAASASAAAATTLGVATLGATTVGAKIGGFLGLPAGPISTLAGTAIGGAGGAAIGSASYALATYGCPSWLRSAGYYAKQWACAPFNLTRSGLSKLRSHF